MKTKKRTWWIVTKKIADINLLTEQIAAGEIDPDVIQDRIKACVKFKKSLPSSLCRTQEQVAEVIGCKVGDVKKAVFLKTKSTAIIKKYTVTPIQVIDLRKADSKKVDKDDGKDYSYLNSLITG